MMLTDSLYGSARVRNRNAHTLRALAVIGLLFWNTPELSADTVTASWNRNSESNIAGYILSYGTQSGTHPTSVDVGNVTSRQVVLNAGQRYYFVVQAYNTSSLVSSKSAEVFIDVGVATPSITSLSPASGSVGTAVTINGANFGATQGTSTVRFNGIGAAITSWSATRIVAVVPSGATTGPITVTVGGVASNGMSFTVATGLPSPWLATDIGSPAVGGSTTYASGTFTINGAGADIWGTADQFHFAYQPVNGDGEIVTRVASLQNTHTWAKAGVMIRESLTGASRCTLAAVSVGNGLAFQRRLTTGGSTSITSGGAGTARYWVRLVRRGSTFSAYRSTTGTSWTLIGSETISMAATVYVGLAVTSHNVSTRATATFTGAAVVIAAGVSSPSLTSLADKRKRRDGGDDRRCELRRHQGDEHRHLQRHDRRRRRGPPQHRRPGPGGRDDRQRRRHRRRRCQQRRCVHRAAGAQHHEPVAGERAGRRVGDDHRHQLRRHQGDEHRHLQRHDRTPTTWSATSIVVPVPAGATTGNVVVTVGGVASNGVAFTVRPTPSITSLAPTSGPVGASVTITGTNFGATKGTSTVTFNGTIATPTTWSATSIVVPVPAGATTGNVVVTVGGLASNGMGFTVSAPRAITLVQRRSQDGGTAASSSLAFSASNGGGNFIAVVIRAGGSGSGLTVTDTRANTYRQAARFTSGTDHVGAIYYAENIGSGANTVTVSVASASTLRFAILEYTGVAASSALDRAVTAVGSSTSPSSGTLTTTTSGDLLLGAITINENVNVVAGAGYTIRESIPVLPTTKAIARTEYGPAPERHPPRAR